MYADEIRRAAEAAPKEKLPTVLSLMWNAFYAGHVTEAEAEELSELIEIRKAVPVASGPTRRRVGSRPRTDASMQRRRRWVASGWLPPVIAAQFTLAEVAALAVVSAEVARRGDCRLCIDHIASLAGIGRSTAKNAIRRARTLGLISTEARKQRPWHNLPNIVRIISQEWQAWNRLTRRSPEFYQEVKSATTTNTKNLNLPRKRRMGSPKGAAERASRRSPCQDRLPG